MTPSVLGAAQLSVLLFGLPRKDGGTPLMSTGLEQALSSGRGTRSATNLTPADLEHYTQSSDESATDSNSDDDENVNSSSASVSSS